MNLSPSPAPSPTGTPGPEEILRRIARLPAPEGLEKRVLDRLVASPRIAPVVAWPHARHWMHSKFVRGLAAAAIVCAVTGGGWLVYSRVAPPPAAKVVLTPPPPGASSGFSSANAVRTPKTLDAPPLPPEREKPLAARKPGRGAHHRRGADAARTQPALRPQ